ncbi:AI-2E family transporter [Aeromicrobium sp. 179-A 4D2 NHS]|uniref:AI-2E family transporter n=1 Tax=Aeromicrobium sp. 179-A 4D2 NHS TaxID=3142375 RepID=UPI0039A2A7D6
MSNEARGTRRYEVPIGVEIAAAWAWRIVLIGGAAYLVLRFLAFFSEVTVPIAVGILLTALLIGAVDWLAKRRVPRILATFIVVIGLLIAVFGLFGLVGQQLSTQFDDLRESVVEGVNQLRDWARNGPLHLSDQQVTEWIQRARDAGSASDGEVVSQATAVGTQIGHFVAGFFLALFTLFFLLYEGDRIWSWVVSLFPRRSRDRVHSSGRAAWGSLTAFVRATVMVALVDAIGIAAVALVLQVPLAAAIGVLVFLGAFIPIIGALLSGMVAVLVALVAHGPVTALLMLAGVVAVQQLESHVLQPFLMGHIVALHPLAILFAIAAGVVAAGIVGALLAVPAAACVNSIVRHLAEGQTVQTDGVLGDESRDLGEPPPAQA